MHNFLCKNVKKFPLYIYSIQKDMTHFGLRVLASLELAVSGHVEPKT